MLKRGICFFFAFALLMLCSFSALGEGEKQYSLPIDFSPGIPPNEAFYIGNMEYQDPSLHVTVKQGRELDCDYWAAYITVSHPSQLRTASPDKFTLGVTSKVEYIARGVNAVLAINGDYWSYSKFGYIIRQGQLCVDHLRGERDVLLIDEDGDFHAVYTPERNTLNGMIDGKKVINAFHFGPVLVDNGEVASLEASSWMAPEERRQRMCIAQTGKLEYLCVCCAGPLRNSAGMTLAEFAGLVQKLGAQTAYNLDGGDSTAMIFHGKKINDVENKKTRDLSDIIYFASAYQ